MSDIKMNIALILEDYEVSQAKKEIIPYEGDINEELLKRFLLSKAVKGCTERTVKYYSECCRKWFGMIGKPVTDWTTDDVRICTAKRLTRDGITKVTVSNEQRALSSFMSYLNNEGVVQGNVIMKAGVTRPDKKKKLAFTKMEVEILRSQMDTTMNTAIFETLLSTGCRITELVNIQIHEITGNEIIVHGKGRKDRKVFLNARAMIAIDAYLKEREDGNPYLFPKRIPVDMNTSMTPHDREWYKTKEFVEPMGHTEVGSIESKIRNVGRKCGVKAYPHKFRRTFATRALEMGMPLVEVSKMLGHNSLETTQVYIDVNEDGLAKSHEKYVI